MSIPFQTVTERQTPNSMSKSLKERLKRLGRYHQSPGQPTLALASSNSNYLTESAIHDNKSAELPAKTDKHDSKRRKTSSSSCSKIDDEKPSSTNDTCESTQLVENISPDDTDCETNAQLNDRLRTLKTVVAAKEERVRKLRLVKMYRVKNDLESLDELIRKWTKTCQQALMELHEKMPPPTPTMCELLAHLQIETQMVAYDPEQEEFLQ